MGSEVACGTSKLYCELLWDCVDVGSEVTCGTSRLYRELFLDCVDVGCEVAYGTSRLYCELLLGCVYVAYEVVCCTGEDILQFFLIIPIQENWLFQYKKTSPTDELHIRT